MTPETEQPQSGYYRRPSVSPGDPPSPVRQFPGRDATAWPPPPFPPATDGTQRAVQPISPATASTQRAAEDRGIVGVIPYLAILACTVAGVYVSWNQGSAGGGKGGVVAGAALLVAAVIRLVLPARLVGLLGTRKRVLDVLTFAFFGGGLLIAGLVLPR
jgi:hypothetical protein